MTLAIILVENYWVTVFQAFHNVEIFLIRLNIRVFLLKRKILVLNQWTGVKLAFRTIFCLKVLKSSECFLALANLKFYSASIVKAFLHLIILVYLNRVLIFKLRNLPMDKVFAFMRTLLILTIFIFLRY
jgi:hypothetical protein